MLKYQSYEEIKDEEFKEALSALKTLKTKSGKGAEFTGWVDLPKTIAKTDLPKIKSLAEEIRKEAEVFVVIGVGGSYLGAKAGLDFVYGSEYNQFKKGPEVYFAGNGFSGRDLKDLLDYCKGKNLYINVISKSGGTLEPALAFRYFKEMLEEEYGSDAAKRIICTTGEKGVLRTLADANGYRTFPVPEDVGGRFSVLSAVGLLPLAVCGLDLDALLLGAEKEAEECLLEAKENPALLYAADRQKLYRAGKTVEFLSCPAESYRFIGEWWKQLFGESEGKEHKGLLPVSAILTKDLHSLGQYIQDGERLMMETFLHIDETGCLKLKDAPNDFDGFNYLSGLDMADVLDCALKGTEDAHKDGGVPTMGIYVDRADEEHLGRLFYFFEVSCAISAYLEGVNPFDQPAVNGYKNNMYALLKNRK